MLKCDFRTSSYAYPVLEFRCSFSKPKQSLWYAGNCASQKCFGVSISILYEETTLKNARLVGCLFLIALVIAGSQWLSPARADKDKDKDKGKKKANVRIATPHDLMEGIVGPNCGALGKALKAETTDWKEIQLRTALLNEAGHLLMAAGRCPDADWAKGAKTVQECSQILAEKAKGQDLDGAKEAFKAMTSQGCATCHKAHKKPSE